MFPNLHPKIVENAQMEHLQEFAVEYIEVDCLEMLAHSHSAGADTEEHGSKMERYSLLAVLNSYAVEYRTSGTSAHRNAHTEWFGLKHEHNILPKHFSYFMTRYNSNYPSENSLGVICRKWSKNQIFNGSNTKMIWNLVVC